MRRGFEKGIFIEGNRSTEPPAPAFDPLQHMQRGLLAATDLSITSAQIRALIVDWISEYHLSAQRTRILHGQAVAPGQRWLEVGAGAAVLSRHLVEQGCEVVVVEPEPALAELARLRLRDLDGVTVLEEFGSLADESGSFDGILMVDTAVRWPLEQTLERIAAFADDTTVLLLGEQNPGGMKYLRGCETDRVPCTEEPVAPGAGPVGIPVAADCLERQGFVNRHCYSPFPDHRLPRAILSTGYIEKDRHADARVDGVSSRDYRARIDFSEEHMFWYTAHRNGMFQSLANSYLYRASRSDVADPAFDFVYFGGANRKTKFLAFTEKSTDSELVRKRSQFPDVRSGAEEREDIVIHTLVEEAYTRGEPLADEWMDLLKDQDSIDALIAPVTEYREWLEGRSDPDLGGLYDALPSNLLRGENGELTPVDMEWRVEQPLEREFILFRGLLYFFLEHHKLLEPLCISGGLRRVIDYLDFFFSRLGLDVFSQIDKFIALEDRIQRAIQPEWSSVDNRAEIYAGIGYEKFHPRLFWSRSGEDCIPENSITMHGAVGYDRQEFVFLLPESVSGLSIIRFDPNNKPGFFRLYRFSIQGFSNGKWTALAEANTESEVARLSSMRDIHYANSGTGDAFVALNSAPVMEWQVTDGGAGPIERFRVLVEMSWTRSVEFRIFENAYLRREQDYVRELNQVSIMKGQLIIARRNEKRFKQELDSIKQSKSWRIISRSRHLFYVGLLGRLPRLQGFLLDFTRAGAKQALLNLFKPGAVEVFDPGQRSEREQTYEIYKRHHEVDESARVAMTAEVAGFSIKPRFSILMPVFNASRRWLEEAVTSVQAQIYGNWELCITDDASTNRETIAYLKTLNDPRITVRYLEKNRNISGATNAGFDVSSGDYIVFMDNDDVMAEQALFELAKVVNQTGADIIYTDEDFIDLAGNRINPHFKCDFSPDLLLSHNYITHLCAVRRSIFEQTGGLRSEFDGAQDYDFLLRATELTGNIQHIPKVLYHWRMSSGSTSLDPEAKPLAINRARQAIEAALQRRGIDGEVMNANNPHFFRVKRRIHGTPLVSIIIPFKDQPRLLAGCLDSVLERSTWNSFEIVGVNNNSEMEDTFNLMEEYAGRYDNVKFVHYDRPFNFSAVVNHGFRHCGGDQVMLMNNDIEIISWDWMEAMIEHSQRPEVGVVGGKLYYEGDTIQHSGIVIGVGNYAGHINKHLPSQRTGYFNRTHIIQNVSAVTGAFMMVKRAVWERLGGFNEEDFTVACNDVDFCLRARELGLLNIFTPYSQAYHFESASRGYEDNAEKKARFEKEKATFRGRHAGILEQGDPYFNPNFSRDHEQFVIDPGRA